MSNQHTESSTPSHKVPQPTKPRTVTVGASLIQGDQPAPGDTFALWADALLFAACPELDAAQAIVQHERQRRSQRHVHDIEIDRLRRLTAEAEARRAG